MKVSTQDPQVHARALVGDARFELDKLFHTWGRLTRIAEYHMSGTTAEADAWERADAAYRTYQNRYVDAVLAAAQGKAG